MLRTFRLAHDGLPVEFNDPVQVLADPLAQVLPVGPAPQLVHMRDQAACELRFAGLGDVHALPGQFGIECMHQLFAFRHAIQGDHHALRILDAVVVRPHHIAPFHT